MKTQPITEPNAGAANAKREWVPTSPGAWELDSHFQRPVTPTHAMNLERAFPLGFREGTRRLGLLLDHEEICVVNGFPYHAPRIVGAPKDAKGPPPRFIFSLLLKLHPEIRRRVKTSAKAFETRPWIADVERFERETRPEALATHRRLQAIDPATLDDARLAEHLDALQANASLRYRQHHELTITVLVPIGDFIVHACDWTGRSAAECVRALGRNGRGLGSAADRELARLVAALAGTDTEARSIRARVASDGGGESTLSALRAAGGEVGVAARAWLDTVGYRVVTGYDIADLYALELPDTIVRTLRAALEGHDGAAAERARKDADELRDAVPAAHRDEYDRLLADTRAISALRDERALYLDLWAYGLLRRAVLEAGRRLVARGRLERADHLVDAAPSEMTAILGGQPGPTAAELAARTRYRTTSTIDEAPPRLGLPPSGPPPLEWMPPSTRRLMRAIEAGVRGLFDEADGQRQAGPAARVNGLGASSGVYQGTARLVLGPEDFGRLRQGDVLVTRSTTEAFNVVLPLLGAVVTDRGGLLCHAATVAREYGIPAVVGSREATRRIGDGARLRVDGTAGHAEVMT